MHIDPSTANRRSPSYTLFANDNWCLTISLSTGYVLKTDDDVFVDTLHVPTFLHTHNLDKKSKTEKLILCFIVKNAVPGK